MTVCVHGNDGACQPAQRFWTKMELYGTEEGDIRLCATEHRVSPNELKQKPSPGPGAQRGGCAHGY